MRDRHTSRLVLTALKRPRRESPGADRSLRSTARKLAAGAVSLLGVSGVLYGIGFLILRSRFSFLGIWGGAPLGSSEIAEEGGKFFYHHVFIPASLLIRLFSSIDFLKLTVGLIALAVVWWPLGKLLSGRRVYSDGPALLPALRRLEGALARNMTLVAMLSVILCAAIDEFIWQVVSLEDVLRAPNELFTNLNLWDESARAFYYYNVLARVAVGVAVSVWLLWSCWRRAGLLQKLIISVQLILTAAAATSLPVAYGKLMLPASFREVSFRDPPPEQEVLLLVAHSSDSWVVWNVRLKRTEVHKAADDAFVIVGRRRDIFE